ncbi:TlpA disulfide reductase family protein [Rhodocytophaga aerolata]|uniref:TlpA disulfide reductase family protein n=1 Tax=Rhodocytophaga aerolata TaxID=455078 RepID=A0ABT8RHY8_9BACT|nr:TlpA disulfide reductase family protein [Rhodocytophaga aerolata]MDO1451700.1 TlpA disulfide reductase family protein [Rhodocytophaga aerolata]
MKLKASILLFLCTPFFGLAQPSPTQVTLAGKFITNSSFLDKLFLLSWTNQLGMAYQDTILLKEDNSFRLLTANIKEPVLASITYQNGKTAGTRLLLAPGYHLSIIVDVVDSKNTRITGKGGEVNSYFSLEKKLLSDSLFVKTYPDPYSLSEQAFESYIRRRKQIADSARQLVFSRATNDPYLPSFERMLHLENRYEVIALVHDQAWYSSKQPQAMIEHLLGTSWKQELNDADNLLSPKFRNFLPYVARNAYWARHGYRVAPDSIPPLYRYEFATEYFGGKVRDYVLGSYIWRDIAKEYASKERFTESMSSLLPFLQLIQDQRLKTYLTSVQKEKLTYLQKPGLRLKAGDRVPAFSLQDEKGKLHSLADFKGKLLYIDLWASWCGPCREQQPDMKRLYEKYKDSPIEFISIALWDRYPAWKKALAKEQPAWLQLFDPTEEIAQAFGVKSIPHFILLDKEGIIRQIHAPKPSAQSKIEALLDQQLAN